MSMVNILSKVNKLPAKYAYQKRAREENMEKVLTALKESPKRFKDLSNLGMSQETLSNILAELQKERKIEKVLHEGHRAYRLTKGGVRSLSDIWGVMSILTELKAKGGRNHLNYTGLIGAMREYNIPWGLGVELVTDRALADASPISEEMALAIEHYLYNQIVKGVRTGNVRFDKTKEGKMVLAITLDYQELARSVELSSLEQFEKEVAKEKE